ncbi:MAG: UPF0182 family protein [Candidatus Fimisoma sp.]|nr:UPF0182 family protein [Candidatus Fimisoma sp.]
MEKRQRRLSIIILIAVLIIGLFVSLIGFISDFLWFREMGYLSVFFKQIVTQLKVGIPTFVVISVLVYLYLNRLKKGYFSKIASSEETNLKKLGKTTVVLSILFGIFATIMAVMQLWFEILKFANSTSFDLNDPLFGFDISFYIFKLDFLTQLNDILIGIIIGFVLLTIIYYIILMTVRTPDVFKEQVPPEAEFAGDRDERYSGSSNPFENGNKRTNNPNDFFGKFSEAFTGKKPQAKPVKPKKQFDDNNFRQLMEIASGKLAMLGFIFFIMLGISFFLQQFDLLQAHTGAVYGAGFTDVNITLWKLRALCVLSVLAAVMFVVQMKRKQYKKILTVPVVMIVVGLVGTGAGMLVQNFIVSPDELSKEAPYLERNIEYTQYAYQLDDVSTKAFAADNTLTAADIAENSETISNIRINDFDPAKQFYNQTQSIRQYYTFNDVDNDRYMIDGKYTQTYLATREIDETKISDSWLNRHLKYTHGYGVTISRVDKVTSSGQPDVLVGNIPPESSVEDIQITRPEIYFGELSNEYIIVGTDEAEFDYPSGESNEYTHYDGTAGIELNLFNRIVFAAREGSVKLLVSSNINSDSKIIINRNVMERIKTIMPDLTYEADPYMVTVDGKLYWMIDAYTTSSNYPYSQPFQEDINYIRNSIKVVVDAYNGDVNFYVVDESDPIAQTYAKIYPKLFRSYDEMPEGLKAHIRYPNTLLQIQANIYARYHMEDISVFYLNEDQWDIAYEIYGTEQAQMTPTYYIAKLPGEEKAEFFNSIPFTPKSKKNMTALMVARNDGDNYGELVLYQFPKSKTIYGPEQVEAQIDQNTEISKEFSLWNSSGTKYRRGNMFIIPINTSILYVEPVYLEATNSSIPEVKRIIVAYGDRIAYEQTLAECLVSLFGEEAAGGVDSAGGSVVEDETAQTKPDGDLTQAELIQKAVDAFNNADAAMKSGDWAAYGKYLDELEDALNKLAS